MLPKTTKSYLFNRTSVSTNIINFAVRKRQCHGYSEQNNDSVITEQCHLFRSLFLELCRFSYGLKTYSKNKQLLFR